MIRSQQIALANVAALRMGSRKRLSFSTLIMRNWNINYKQIQRAGIQTVLKTPDEVRGIRFGWKRRESWIEHI